MPSGQPRANRLWITLWAVDGDAAAAAGRGSVTFRGTAEHGRASRRRGRGGAGRRDPAGPAGDGRRGGQGRGNRRTPAGTGGPRPPQVVCVARCGAGGCST